MTAAAAQRPAEVTATSPMARTINKGLMVAWINADLLNRADCDVRSSLVIYDADGDFLYAFPPCFKPTDKAWSAMWIAGARTWSKGIV